jgi:cyclase
MLRPRVIPCLLIQDSGLVKTVKFKDPIYVGDPINAVKIFNEKHADEIIVLDIDATAKGHEPNFKKIAYIAAECRMPLCYGGGIKTAQQAKKIVSLGVEKVAISSSAITRPELIKEIAEEVGTQSAVVVLDVKSRFMSKSYDVYTHNGKRNTKKNYLELSVELVEKGAGEIIINSIDNDGLMKGYDLQLASEIRRAVNVPITIMGGAGSIEHMKQVVSICGVVGLAAGSFFVFKGSLKAVLISYPTQEQKDLLLKNMVNYRDIHL